MLLVIDRRWSFVCGTWFICSLVGGSRLLQKEAQVSGEAGSFVVSPCTRRLHDGCFALSVYLRLFEMYID
jgi:hypothetical protein